MSALEWIGLAALLISTVAVVLCAPSAFRAVHRPAPSQHWCRNCEGTGIQFRSTMTSEPKIIFCEDIEVR